MPHISKAQIEDTINALNTHPDFDTDDVQNDAVTMLQSLLEQQEGEPVATMVALGRNCQTYIDWHSPTPPAGTNLFTHPPALQTAKIAELEAQLAVVQADAARYRWLCDGAIFSTEGINFESLPSKYQIVWKDGLKGTIDTAIDAAIAGEAT